MLSISPSIDMAIDVIRCPNCGGDVDVIPSKSIIECPYCNSDIVNTFFEDKKEDIANYLISAKNELSRGNYSECGRILDRVCLMEPDCSDVWYMRAAMYSADADQFQIYKERALRAKVSFNVFSEADMERYRAMHVKVKKNFTAMWFGIGAFMIIFFGGALSLGLGIGFGTLVPLYVTIALLVILLAVYLVVAKLQKR